MSGILTTSYHAKLNNSWQSIKPKACSFWLHLLYQFKECSTFVFVLPVQWAPIALPHSICKSAYLLQHASWLTCTLRSKSAAVEQQDCRVHMQVRENMAAVLVKWWQMYICRKDVGRCLWCQGCKPEWSIRAPQAELQCIFINCVQCMQQLFFRRTIS